MKARVHAAHVVTLPVRHHFQSQLVVVAEKQRPLRGLRNRRGLLQNIHDGGPVLHPQGHEQAWHQRKMKGHVAFVTPPGSKVGRRVVRPLIGFGQQHAVPILGVHILPQTLQKCVRLRQVLAARAFPLVEIRHSVQPHPVHSQAHPKIEHPEHLLVDGRMVKIQIRLVKIKAVPIVGVGHRVPGPIGWFVVFENDPCALAFFRRVAPHVVVPPPAAGSCPARPLEPGVLVGSVVQDQFGDHAQPAVMGLAQK